MGKSLLLAFLVIFMVSCKSGSGGGGGVQAVNIEPQGFKASGPASKELPERFSAGCATLGEPANDYSIDSRLAVGHEFSFDVRVTSDEGYRAAVANQKITRVTANSVSSTYRVLSQVNFPTPGNLFNETCTRTGPDVDGNYDWDCAETKLSISPLSLNESSCTIYAETADDLSDSIIPGTYMGKAAYWQTISVRGEIECDNVKLGRGSMVSNSVLTNQVPSTDIYYCGGVTVFIGNEMKLDNGKVLSSSMMSHTKTPTVRN